MNDSPTSGGPMAKGLWMLLALAIYVLAQGPLHGLYYNERLSDEASTVFIWLYKPLNKIELLLPDGNPMSRYTYWWYIYIKYGQPPVNGGPPHQGAKTA